MNQDSPQTKDKKANLEFLAFVVVPATMVWTDDPAREVTRVIALWDFQAFPVSRETPAHLDCLVWTACVDPRATTVSVVLPAAKVIKEIVVFLVLLDLLVLMAYLECKETLAFLVDPVRKA